MRTLRLKMSGIAAGYHVVSRVIHQNMLLNDDMKSYFVYLLRKMKTLYYVKYAAYAVLDNHFHLLLRFEDSRSIDPYDAIERWNAYHAKSGFGRNPDIEKYREYVVHHLTDVSSFMKRFKYHLTTMYNAKFGTHGTIWQERYHSTIVQRGWSMLNCAAYIDLNGFRASMAHLPEEFKYCSLHALLSGNPHELLDPDMIEEGLHMPGSYTTESEKHQYYQKVI